MSGEAVERATEAEAEALTGTVRAAAAVSFGAALIHASVIATHFREYWLFGVFFVVVAVLQFAWAGAVWTRGMRPTLLAAGALGNLAVGVIWFVSRTVGLPFGPGAGEREEVGIHDVLATTDELAIFALVTWLLIARRPAWGPFLVGAWALAADSAVVAFLGGHEPH